MTLAYYRLNFRNYYVSNQGALPLPDARLEATADSLKANSPP